MATSKKEILKTSRVLIQQNGWEAVNIRAVAAACGVSVGCIYNYFGSKTELVSAAVESIWSDIFRHPDDPAVFEDTLSCIRWMYRQMEYGSEQYPGFFMAVGNHIPANTPVDNALYYNEIYEQLSRR